MKSAPDLAEQITKELESNVSEEVVDLGKEIATRVQYEHPINHCAKVVAASSLYLAGLANYQKLTQRELADAADINRDAFRVINEKIAEHEDFKFTLDAEVAK